MEFEIIWVGILQAADTFCLAAHEPLQRIRMSFASRPPADTVRLLRGDDSGYNRRIRSLLLRDYESGYNSLQRIRSAYSHVHAADSIRFISGAQRIRSASYSGASDSGYDPLHVFRSHFLIKPFWQQRTRSAILGLKHGLLPGTRTGHRGIAGRG